MTNSLSEKFRVAIHAEHTDEAILSLLTVTHSDLDKPLNFCDRPVGRLSEDPLEYGVISRSIKFVYLPFALTLPNDKEGTPSSVSLQMDNVDRELIATIRSTNEPARAKIELLLEDSPNQVEVVLPEYDMRLANYSDAIISFELQIPTLHRVAYPSGAFTPDAFGNLF